MSYEPTVWKDGDLVTSAKLNKMEQGIARYDVVESTQEGDIITLNKTWQEIWDNNYTTIIDNTIDSYKSFAFIVALDIIEGETPLYLVAIYQPGLEVSMTFTCNSPDAYPSHDASSQEQGDSSGEDAHDGRK